MFFRTCPDHRVHLDERSDIGGTESVKCPRGHEIGSWLITNDKGVIVGRGFTDRPGILLTGFLDAQEV